jgi:hypothetical protein
MLELGLATVPIGGCSLSRASVNKPNQQVVAGMFEQIENIALRAFVGGVA